MVFVSCLLRDRAQDWWEEVGRALATKEMVAISWKEFVMRFHEEFTPAIKV